MHNVASFVESAWRNEGSDFATNGERFVLERFGAANFQVAIDAGANFGDWSRNALELWPTCQIHAFEVAPATYERLEAEFRPFGQRNRVKIYQMGLSDESGVRLMYYFPDSPQLTCDMPRHHCFKSVPFQAEMTTLDAFCDQHHIDSIDFLKIDVEGAEYLVIKGANRLLIDNAITCIQFEYGPFSTDTRFMLKDYYGYLSQYYYIGKIYPNYIDFREYDWTMEDFKFCNYLCVSKKRRDLLNLFEN
jgi:FkbM family methyltransferase